jgi:predicted ATPase with chaperone activity
MPIHTKAAKMRRNATTNAPTALEDFLVAAPPRAIMVPAANMHHTAIIHAGPIYKARLLDSVYNTMTMKTKGDAGETNQVSEKLRLRAFA